MPPKYGELPADAVIDRMIENEIDFWVESKQREAEQMDLYEKQQDFDEDTISNFE